MTDPVHAALLEIRDLVDNALRDYSDNKHWMNLMRAHHANGTSYDRDGGTSSTTVDLSVRVIRPDPGTAISKRYRRAATTAQGAMRDIDSLRRQLLTTKSMAPQVGEDPTCAHCGNEDRYRGDLGRRCYDWKRSHGHELPPAFVLEAWRRGKQPKVRVG